MDQLMQARASSIEPGCVVFVSENESGCEREAQVGVWRRGEGRGTIPLEVLYFLAAAKVFGRP